jgi:hypothetical protein
MTEILQGFRARILFPIVALLVVGTMSSTPSAASARLRTEIQMGDPTDTDWGPTPKKASTVTAIADPHISTPSDIRATSGTDLHWAIRILFAMRLWRMS